MSEAPLQALDDLLARGGEPDDVLRSAVSILASEPGVRWAGIAFQEDDHRVLGPEAGQPDEARRARVPVVFQGSEVGEIWVDGEVERALLERIASRLAVYVVVGWDTGGERWEP